MKWQIYPPKSASSSEWSFLISIVKAHIGRSRGRSNPPVDLPVHLNGHF